VFCLLVVLVKLSLLAKWLARKTPLRKPNRGEGIISIKSRPKRAYELWLCWFIVFFRCFIARYLCSSWPYMIHFLLLWHDTAYFCWKCRKTPTKLCVYRFNVIHYSFTVLTLLVEWQERPAVYEKNLTPTFPISSLEDLRRPDRPRGILEENWLIKQKLKH